MAGKEHQFPQLGGGIKLRQPISKATGEPKLNERGNPVIKLSASAVDLANPVAVAAAKRNVLHSIDTASPKAFEEGRTWYPKASEAVSAGIKKRGFLSSQMDKHLAGSGIIASASPGMDWEENVKAVHEVSKLKSADWDTIMAGGAPAQDVYKHLSIASQSVENMQKVGRIVRGEHPDDVLNYASAPKTNSFMHNIHEPDSSQWATIDGRAFDVMSNKAIPWQAGRNIGGSKPKPTKSGAPPKEKAPPKRYVQATGVMQDVGAGLGMAAPTAQAISWTAGQEIEQDYGKRKQGPSRVGQPYFHPETGEPVIHDPSYRKEHKGRMDHFKAGLGI